MSRFRKLGGGLVIAISAIMLLLSLTGSVGIWLTKGTVTERLSHIFKRIDAALTLADDGLEQVNASFATARERLDAVKVQQGQIGQAPQSGNLTRRMMARTVQQRIAPEIDNAQEKLHTVAEAAVVVNSILEDLGNVPFLSALGLDVGSLSQVNSTLSQVEASAWELGRLFSENSPDSDSSAQINRIDTTLGSLSQTLSAYSVKVKDVRERVGKLQSGIAKWTTPAVAAISFICFWIAISQISLICHAKRLCS